MKEMRFTKDEAELIKNCLKNEIFEHGHSPQNKRYKTEQTLLKRLERAEKPIKASSAKGKGRNFQHWVCQKVADILGLPFNQSDDACLIHSREMGQKGCDVVLRGEARARFPFDVECKAAERINIAEWIAQARENSRRSGRAWLLVFKKKSIGEPCVCLDWNSFDLLFRLALGDKKYAGAREAEK